MADTRESSHLLLVTLALYLNSCTHNKSSNDSAKPPELAERRSPNKVRLNSECIEEKFGSYAIELMAVLDNYRLANLYSEQNNIRTTRTLALVKFAQPIPKELARVHPQIVKGASIGATFKSAGWHIQKDPLRNDTLSVDPNNATVYEHMRLGQGQPLAMQSYKFSVFKQQQVHYADIVEIYHPEYLPTDALPTLDDQGSSKIALSQRAIRTMLSELLPASTD